MEMKRIGGKSLNVYEPCECMICKNNKNFDMPEDIIESVLKNNLVLFCGADISTESKSVFPESFYTSILCEIEDKTNKKVDLDTSFSRIMSLYINTFPNGRRKLLNKIKVARWDITKNGIDNNSVVPKL